MIARSSCQQKINFFLCKSNLLIMLHGLYLFMTSFIKLFFTNPTYTVDRREVLMKFNMIVRSLALAGILGSVSMPLLAAEASKDAKAPTQQANNALYNQLPFSDNTDFTNAHKGFIAPLPQEVIKGEQGNVIWNPQQYSFIKEGDKAPDTVNPSLWRQSQLINISGLFKSPKVFIRSEILTCRI